MCPLQFQWWKKKWWNCTLDSANNQIIAYDGLCGSIVKWGHPFGWTNEWQNYYVYCWLAVVGGIEGFTATLFAKFSILLLLQNILHPVDMIDVRKSIKHTRFSFKPLQFLSYPIKSTSFTHCRANAIENWNCFIWKQYCNIEEHKTIISTQFFFISFLCCSSYYGIDIVIFHRHLEMMYTNHKLIFTNSFFADLWIIYFALDINSLSACLNDWVLHNRFYRRAARG